MMKDIKHRVQRLGYVYIIIYFYVLEKDSFCPTALHSLRPDRARLRVDP